VLFLEGGCGDVGAVGCGMEAWIGDGGWARGWGTV
jgi:hypothetical protein